MVLLLKNEIKINYDNNNGDSNEEFKIVTAKTPMKIMMVMRMVVMNTLIVVMVGMLMVIGMMAVMVVIMVTAVMVVRY